MKKVLRLKRIHPNGFMQHGRYVVTPKATEFNLNENEEKLLNSDGPRHWIEVVGVIEKTEKSVKKVAKKAKGKK